MKRFNTDISTTKTAFQKTPKVLYSVGVNVTVNILHRVVNHFVRVLTRQSLIGKKSISIKSSTRLNVLLNFALERRSFTVSNNLCTHFTAALKNAHNSNLIFAARSCDASFLNVKVHIASLATDESLIGFTLARELFFKRTCLHCKA